MNLDHIVSQLNERKQRASYGAVAGILGVIPRSLMTGRPRSPKYSWVVVATGPQRGWPTGYKKEQIHPDCLTQILRDPDNVIADSEALSQWLKG
jgi:hypothetical protein